jgi:hypothetical protein
MKGCRTIYEWMHINSFSVYLWHKNALKWRTLIDITKRKSRKWKKMERRKKWTETNLRLSPYFHPSACFTHWCVADYLGLTGVSKNQCLLFISNRSRFNNSKPCSDHKPYKRSNLFSTVFLRNISGCQLLVIIVQGINFTVYVCDLYILISL